MHATTVTVQPFGSEHSFTIDIADVHAQLQAVPDQRKRRGVRYPLAVLLTIALIVKLSGYSQLRALAEWARERAVELAALFGLERTTMPHPTTWSRVLSCAVAATAIEQATTRLLAPPPSAEVPARASRPIALDGKTLCGTIPAGSSQGVHLLSAYDVTEGRVLEQGAVASKENEIVAAPRVLKALDLHGAIVTGDAMFAQRALRCQIVASGGDYCWIVKQNQGTLYDDLKLLFSPAVLATTPGWSPIPLDFVTVETVDKGHGRLEERRLTVSSMLADYADWPYLAQAFEVVRIRREGNRVSREERYGITSAPLSALAATQLLGVVRGHWRIETGLHRRRDVTLGEDASQVRMGCAPHILASLNNAVCGLAAKGGMTNLAALQRSLAAAFDRLLFRR